MSIIPEWGFQSAIDTVGGAVDEYRQGLSGRASNGTSSTKSTRAQRLYDEIATPKRQQTGMKFPLDLDTAGHGNIMRININIPEGSKYLGGAGGNAVGIDPSTGKQKTSVHRQSSSSSLARRFSNNTVRTDTVIDLYMPATIESSYQTNWNSKELGVAGAALDASMGLSNVNDWNDAEQAWQAVKNTVPTALINSMTGTLQALTPVNVEDARSVVTNTAVNPYMEVLFDGVENRTFGFTFKMIPRNAAEQEMIKKIVDTMKFHRAPEAKFQENNNYWIFPSEFDIKFIHRGNENPWLFKISTCALTNITVNHSPEGQYSSHADGSPFATEMSLQFTELEILTKERHLEGY